MPGRIQPRQQSQNAIAATTPTTSRPPLALTTIFTPPPSCLSTVTYDGTTLWQAGISQRGDAACYPESFRSIYNSHFSPGICPQSYFSAGALSHSTGYEAMCCPSNYILSTTKASVFLANYCFSLMTTPLTNVVYVPSLTNGPAPASARFSTLRQNDVKSTTVYADVIQVQWRAVDQQIIALMSETSASGSASPTSSPSSSPGPTTSSAMPAATSATPMPTYTTSSGLSTGAKIGIGIGVPLGVIALAALAALLFLFRRRKRRSAAAQTRAPGNQTAPDGPPMHDLKDPKILPPGYHELPRDEVQPPAEMDATSTPEMPGSSVASELPPQHQVVRDSSGSAATGNPGGYLSPEKVTPVGSPGFSRMGSGKYSRGGASPG